MDGQLTAKQTTQKIMSPLPVVCVKYIFMLHINVMQHKQQKACFVVLCKLFFNVKITNQSLNNSEHVNIGFNPTHRKETVTTYGDHYSPNTVKFMWYH